MIAQRQLLNRPAASRPTDSLGDIPTGAQMLVAALVHEGVDAIFDTRAAQYFISTTNYGAPAINSPTTWYVTNKAPYTWPKAMRARPGA